MRSGVLGWSNGDGKLSVDSDSLEFTQYYWSTPITDSSIIERIESGEVLKPTLILDDYEIYRGEVSLVSPPQGMTMDDYNKLMSGEITEKELRDKLKK